MEVNKERKKGNFFFVVSRILSELVMKKKKKKISKKCTRTENDLQHRMMVDFYGTVQVWKFMK